MSSTTLPSSTPAPALSLLPTKQRSLWGDAWRRLLRNRLSIIGLTITALLLFIALFGPTLAPYS
jgi:ABC-type antimicrobial peptide transport system permease subunit